MKRDRTIKEVEQFISNKLKKNLRDDLRNFRIVREADIECCAYYHLRRFAHSGWRILARKHVKKTGHFVDFVLFRNGMPEIAIELKWWRSEIDDKDRDSLGQMLKFPVKKAYFICVIPDSSRYTKLGHNKTKLEKGRLIEIRIGLKWKKSRVDVWKKKRKRYTDQMGVKLEE